MTIRNVPTQLADTWTRLHRAKDNYETLVREVNIFMYDHVKGMIKGWDPKKQSFVLRLRHPRESVMTGTPRALVVDIVEDLRSALDYMVFELSALAAPDLNEKVPQFVIADTKRDFDQQSKRLRYLTREQKSEFIERLQPFNGNHILGLLRDISGQSKHRRLLSVRDNPAGISTLQRITKEQNTRTVSCIQWKRATQFLQDPRLGASFCWTSTMQ